MSRVLEAAHTPLARIVLYHVRVTLYGSKSAIVHAIFSVALSTILSVWLEVLSSRNVVIGLSLESTYSHLLVRPSSLTEIT